MANQVALIKRMTALQKADLASLSKPLSLPQAKTNDAKLEALRVLARKAGAGLEFLNQISEARLWNLRRAGELLVQVVPHKGGRNTSTLPALGVSQTESSRWQALAAIPEKRWAREIDLIKAAARKELTAADMFKLVG